MKEHPRWTTTSELDVDSARANFAEIIEQARVRPQTIVRDGAPAVVVVSAEEWQRRGMPKDSLADFLLRSPLRGIDLDLERIKDTPRDIDL